MKQDNILFLNLTTFSRVGGIENFNKGLLQALNEFEHKGVFGKTASISAYDGEADAKYYPIEKYKGFSGTLVRFVIHSIRQSRKYDQIIVGHVNLGIIGCAIRLLHPRKKMILITHGVDVWGKLSFLQRSLLKAVDEIWSVSNFTAQKLIDVQGVAASKIKIFWNSLGPDFILPADFSKPSYLLDRYKISPDTKVLLTIARLSSNDKYKGYDQIFECLASERFKGQKFCYIIGGKGDAAEIERINRMVDDLGLKDTVKLIGYIEASELNDYYKLADIFVMPSKGEGFGIVFIEAMACGTPAIGGSKDGGKEALLNGEVGVVVDPDDNNSISDGIEYLLANKQDPKVLQDKVLKAFSYDSFKSRLKAYLTRG